MNRGKLSNAFGYIVFVHYVLTLDNNLGIKIHSGDGDGLFYKKDHLDTLDSRGNCSGWGNSLSHPNN